MNIYKKNSKGIPHYLVRHYWWAYLWPPAVWFFDHPWIINLILFGNYEKLKRLTLEKFESIPQGRVLMLTSAYGTLIPDLVQHLSPRPLHLVDVADIQLKKAFEKVGNKERMLLLRMNAEQLAIQSNSISTLLIFFLLHELPEDARRRALSEAMRVVPVGGRVLCAEYNNKPTRSFLTRFNLSRKVLTKLEPFLESFWQNDLIALLNDAAAAHGKLVQLRSKTEVFSDFYQVCEFEVIEN